MLHVLSESAGGTIEQRSNVSLATSNMMTHATISPVHEAGGDVIH